MPERNLVKFTFAIRCFMMLVVAVTIGAMQSGCSKLSQSTFSRDILGGKKSAPRWSRDNHDSADRYFTDPYADLDSVPKKDEARIVGIRDGESDDISVKLVASPAPKIDDDCEHDTGCDCHKPKEKPKLPYAEPIDPPPISALELARTEPPAEIVHQPLTPILFDNQTRQIQTQDVGNSINSLRRNDEWSHEKSATISQKPVAVDLASVEPNPVRFSPSGNPLSRPIRATELIRSSDNTEATQSGIQEVATRALPNCVSCSDANCNGGCGKRTVASTKIRPIVDSEPIVIVATTSNDSVPPFAEFPPEDEQSELVAEMEFAVPAPAIEPERMADATETDSFDDLSDDEWLAMFGPMDANEAGCQSCETGHCEDPNCLQPVQPSIAIADSTAEEPAKPMSSELIAAIQHAEALIGNSLESTTPESIVGSASPIETTAKPGFSDSSNDFQPVSHSEPASIEIEIETPSWTQPETPDPLPIPAESPTLDPRPVDTNANEFQPINASPIESKPALPLPEVSPEQPVRVEIIDKTVPWETQLTDTIESVKTQLASETEVEKRNALEVNVRLLEVLQRQMTDIEVQTDSLSDEQKQAWQHQLDAFTLTLKSSDSSDSDLTRHSSAIDTLIHLRKAVEQLESMAELKISNGAFCTEVSGFGQFKTFPSTTFVSNQRMLIYCEVENYSSMDHYVNFQMVRTRLRGSYVIYNQQGRAVQQAEYPIVEDVARKRRRDFYMHFPIQLDNLAPGQYRLELLVEDLDGNKTGSIEPELEFEVR